MLKKKSSKKTSNKEDLKEYYLMVKPILLHPEFLKRKEIKHHNGSVYDHCLQVSLCGYHIAKKLKPYFPELSIQDVAIAGLLHDFYSTPWRESRLDKRFFRKHGFTHAYEASKNAYTHFPDLMDPYVEDAITHHMFPLNRKFPRYIESWIVTTADKIISMDIVFDLNELPRYLGINIPKKNE